MRELKNVRGGTQKRRRAVRRFVARQKDLKNGRESVRDKIVRLHSEKELRLLYREFIYNDRKVLRKKYKYAKWMQSASIPQNARLSIDDNVNIDRKSVV